jgi:allantoinase
MARPQPDQRAATDRDGPGGGACRDPGHDRPHRGGFRHSPVGWLGAGLAETWNTLDYLAEAGIRYVCDWVNDDQPYRFELGTPPLVSLPYSVQTNDVPAYFEMKVSVPEFEAMLKRQFDTLYREGETVPRVMAIAVHPFVTGQPHRIGALDAALEYICSHAGVWRATGWEIVQHYLSQQS